MKVIIVMSPCVCVGGGGVFLAVSEKPFFVLVQGTILDLGTGTVLVFGTGTVLVLGILNNLRKGFILGVLGVLY